MRVFAADAEAWLRMRAALWPPGGPEDDHAASIAAFFDGRAREPLAVLVADADDGRLLGFAELSIRPYAEGCATDRVAFLEGWYVVPEARRQGVGEALVAATEAWGRSMGCTELASDTEIHNDLAAAAHRALGFVEVAQVRCFKKDL